MDDKNELNDLLLGSQKEGNSSKKFFLIAAGVLLLFFTIIGIMKFMGSSETKQPLPITASEQQKKIDLPAPSVAEDNASSDGNDSNATADEKLDAIVKKLQQEAKESASAAPIESVPVAPVPVPIVESKPKQPSLPPQKTEPAKKETKTTVVTLPVKTIGEKGTAQKESQVKTAKSRDDVKKVFKEATKNVAKPTPKDTKHNIASDKNGSQKDGPFFIQVGYVDSESQTKVLRDKVNSIGYGSTTRASVMGEKNITKVWVGPFDSREEAQKALPKIREQIKNDAFITRD